jgi:N-acetylglucosaminyl-diphospho-decaprenol L-rhamnosyltransferase
MLKGETEVSVIIVSYNTADLIGACLRSILSSRDLNTEVFVVDNASTDGSASVIQKGFPSVEFIANNQNRGFGAANNQALQMCRGKYVVFLNPDTTVLPDSLSMMAAFMDAHRNVGLAGPMVCNADGSRQDSVSLRYPGHRHGFKDLGVLPGRIACVLGACQIARADLLRELNGFDEDFFLYGEDQDLCLRVRKKGFEIAQISNTTILHHGAQSERSTRPEEIVRKKLKAQYIFYKKHYKPQSICRIRHRQRLRARWQIFLKLLILPFCSNSSDIQQKLSSYRAVLKETNRIVIK